jgi:hypothetical protein
MLEIDDIELEIVTRKLINKIESWTSMNEKMQENKGKSFQLDRSRMRKCEKIKEKVRDQRWRWTWNCN